MTPGRSPQVKQLKGKEHKPPIRDNWVKTLLSTSMPTRARPSALPARSLQKSHSFSYKRADRKKKKNHNPLTGMKITSQKVQFSSVTQLCLTLCDPKDCSTPGLPVHHKLPEFT